MRRLAPAIVASLGAACSGGAEPPAGVAERLAEPAAGEEELAPGAAPAPACTPAWTRLHMPWPAGAERRVLQGWDGEFSHRGTHAIDVGLALGEPVAAVADGIASQVFDDFADDGEPSVDKVYRANFVELDHGNGIFSLYEHLQRGSAAVREGDAVAAGTVLGRVGNSGYTTGPHLHFELHDVHRRSLPICFDGISGGVPRAGVSYRSANRAPDPDRRVEVVPANLGGGDLAGAGVRLFVGVPARRLARDSPPRLVGRTEIPGEDLVLLFAPGDRGPRMFVGTPIPTDARGHFDVELPLPSHEGRYVLDIYARSRTDAERAPWPVVVRPRSAPAPTRAAGEPEPFPRDGAWIDRYDDGRIAERGAFADGAPDGVWEGFYESGQPRYRGAFDRGLEVGPWTTWHPGGAKKSEGDFEAGRPHGRWRRYDSDGIAVADHVLERGNGEYVERFPDGTLRLTGRYRDGRRDGEWLERHRSGKNKELRTYRRGTLEGRFARWYYGGRRELTGAWLAGRPHGRWDFWHLDGTRAAAARLVRGELHGQLRSWDHAGRLVLAARFSRGRVLESRYYQYDDAAGVIEIAE